jgi:hypothetical protein
LSDSDSFFANEIESDAERHCTARGDEQSSCELATSLIRRTSRFDTTIRQCIFFRMRRFGNTRLARMSSGHYCVIRDLGLVKGGKGLRHHEVVLDLTLRGLWRGALKSAKAVLRPRVDWRQTSWTETSAQEGASEPVLAAQTTRGSRG